MPNTLSAAHRSHAHPGIALVGISLAYFMVLLDTTVLAVAEPDIIVSLHTDVIGVGWATTSYTMALAAALVLAGAVADRYGAFRIFQAGALGFGLLSLACAGAPNLPLLLVARVLLGLFAAAIVPSSLGLIAGLYPGPAARGRAISLWAAISGAAMAAGPVLGGWLIEAFGWRAVFIINAPIALLTLLLCAARIRTVQHDRPLSVLPHLGLAATLAALTLAITTAGQQDWPLAIGAGLATVVLAVVTIAVDARAASPLIPTSLRRNATVWAAFMWGGVINYALTTVIFCVPLLLHTSPLQAGVTLLPMTLLVALNPILTGRIVARRGPLFTIRLGFLAFPIGLALIGDSLTTAADASLSLEAGLLLAGLGISWTLPALVGFAVSHAASDATGAVGGILNATRQVGATLAAAIASALLTQTTNPLPTHLLFTIASGLCLAGLATATLGQFTKTKP